MNERKFNPRTSRWIPRRVRVLYRLLRTEFAKKTSQPVDRIFAHELEPRVLYDASPLAVAFPGDSLDVNEQPEQNLFPDTQIQPLFDWADVPLTPELVEPSSPHQAAVGSELSSLYAEQASSSVELLAIDSRILQSESLLDQLTSLDHGYRNLEVIVVDPDSSGVNVLSERLKTLKHVGAIHLVAWEQEQGTWLGQSDLGSAAVSGLSSTFTLWRQSLDPDGCILLYGWPDASASNPLQLAEQTLLWSEPGIEDSLSLAESCTIQLTAGFYGEAENHDPADTLERDLETLLGVSTQLATGWLDAPSVAVNGDWSDAFQEAELAEWNALPSTSTFGTPPREEVVFIDGSLAGVDSLVAAWSMEADPWRNITIVVIDHGDDGINFIGQYLAESQTRFSAVHLVSHGFAGGFHLGSAVLTGGSLDFYQESLANWQLNLTDHADLLLYGCFIADGTTGQEFVTQLARRTGLDVAASTDATGSTRVGGDWNLEFQVGQFTADSSLRADASWEHLLLTYTVADDFGTAAYSNNSGTNNWAANWTENDGGSGPTAGSIYISGGGLIFRPETNGEWISRQADLSGAHSATLSFTFDNTMDSQGDAVQIDLQISADGGATWSTLDSFSNTVNTAAGSKSYDITSSIASNTTVRFIVTDNDGSPVYLYLDNFQISYQINAAPTAVADTAIAVEAGGVSNGTAGTNPSGNVLTNDTDPDAGDTKTVTGVAAGTVGSASGNVASNVTGTYGSINISASGAYTYTVDNSNAAVQALRTSGNTLTDTFTYTMRDALGLTSTTQVTITIQGANDAPHDLLGALSIAENVANGSAVGTLTRSDVDTGDTATYSLLDDAGGRFAINSSTGVVTVANGSLLDREAAASHNITVRVTDTAGATYSEVMTVTITDVDEFDVGAVSDSNAAANSLAENSANGTAVGITASASDADATTNTITYTLDNNSFGRFAINSSTGVVTVANSSLLNYEAATSHSITVRATSADGSWSTQTYTISLTDVDEFDVGAVTDTETAANSVVENSANGTTVGITASASDADATTKTITYTLDNSAGGRFAINSSTGVVTVANSSLLDREAAASHSITVRATSADGSWSTQSFTINLTDVDEFDVGAVTDGNAAANSVAENSANGTAVGLTASASDADATTNTITYTLDDTAGGRFAINSSTGVVTVANGSLLDFETATSHNITVRATSADGSWSTQTFTINLTNVNETPTAVADTAIAVEAGGVSNG
ncbi:MAG: DUF4347 domain-containing protein, partial [Planctomycetota bacterium]